MKATVSEKTSDDNDNTYKVCKGADRRIYLYKIDAVVTAGLNPAPRPNDIVAFNWRKPFAIAGMAQGSRCDGDVYAGSWGQRVEAGKQEGVDVSGINLVWGCRAVFGSCRGVAGRQGRRWSG